MHCFTSLLPAGTWSRAGFGLPIPDTAVPMEDRTSPSPPDAASEDPSVLLRQSGGEEPMQTTGEITKGLRIAEGWSERGSTRGPKASSKSYLDQQSLSTEPAHTGYRKHTASGEAWSQARPGRGLFHQWHLLPGSRQGMKGRWGLSSSCAFHLLGLSIGSWLSPQIQPSCSSHALITACLSQVRSSGASCE